MTDRTPFERHVEDRIAEEPRSLPLRSDFITELNARAGRTRQRPRWLALLKEPPMRTNSRTIVGSPTTRFAAILAATFLLAVALAAAGVAGQRLLAADEESDAGATIVVAADGSGDYETISAAVAAASDGDTILVRPGRYTESVRVDKDVTIEGDGAAADVAVLIPSDGPSVQFDDGAVRYAFDLSDSDAIIRDLRLGGITLDNSAVIARRGSPTIDGLLVNMPGWGMEGLQRALAYVGADADLTLQDIKSNSYVWVGEGGNATLTGSEYDGFGFSHPGFEVVVHDGSNATIRGNAINHVDVREGGSALIDDNVLVGSLSTCGIRLTGAGSGTVVSRNELYSNEYGMCLTGGSSTVVENNRLKSSWAGGTAMRVEESDALIKGNSIINSVTGVALSGGAPALEDNVITGNRVGMKLRDGAAPIMAGNRICGNTTDMEWPDDSEPPDLSANEACDD